MTPQEWKLRKELVDTKLQLYGAQNAYLQLASQIATNELVALGPMPTDEPEAPA